jgi:hypothetical protein
MGVRAALSSRAARLLTACSATIDGDGTIVATLEALADRAMMSPATAKRAMRELTDAGLVHTSGATAGTYRYLDDRVRKALQQPVARRTTDAGWRQVRAQSGGYQRAMHAAQRRSAAAEAALAVLQSEVQALRAGGSTPSSGRSLAWLRLEATHAVRCFDAECARCLELDRVLDDDADAEDVDDAARDALSSSSRLRVAAVELCEAWRDRGVGRATRVADAMAKVERSL